jgi:hypothetical protein
MKKALISFLLVLAIVFSFALGVGAEEQHEIAVVVKVAGVQSLGRRSETGSQRFWGKCLYGWANYC